MSILNFFRKVDKVPSDDDEGLRELLGPTVLKEVNSEFRKISDSDSPGTSTSTQKKKKYNVYSPKDRADIGKFCLENGPSQTVRKFSPAFPGLNESTARYMRDKFKQETSSRKRKLDFGSIDEITPAKRGRPLKLGEDLDSKVQKYIRVIRQNGSVVNTSIAKSLAKGIVTATDCSLLVENGGTIDFTKAWAKSLLKRMNFVKRKGSTACKADKVENFEELKIGFLDRIKETVSKHEIPANMIINWDHAGLNLVPVSDWTMEVEGSKRVEISGLGDKRQFTAVFAGTLTGDFLPPQIIFAGKTTRSLPVFKFPKNWDITFTENHWANTETQMAYVDNVILPYLKQTRKELGLPSRSKALCIFDVFRAQMTEAFLEHLKSNNICVVFVPACCTDRLQPMDLTVQKTVKSKLKQCFETWYSEQIVKQIQKNGPDDTEPLQLSITSMKELVSKWLVKMFQEVSNQPDLIVNGFRAAGILQILEDDIPLGLTKFIKK